MTEVNVTAMQQSINDQQFEQNLITDESLNAGSLLSGDAYDHVDDGRVTEVAVSPQALAEMLPKESADPIIDPATESLYIELGYLREDIVNAQGMSQKFAAEAIAIKPDFGGKPLAYYSKLPSRTRLQASLEEIDETMRDTAAGQLAVLSQMVSNVLKTPRFSVVAKLHTNEFSWNHFCKLAWSVSSAMDQFDRDAWPCDNNAVSTSLLRNAPDSATMTLEDRMAQQLAARMGAYDVYVVLPTVVEYLTDHVKAWNTNLVTFLNDSKGAKPGTFEEPEAAKVVGIGTNTLPVTQVGNAMGDALVNASNDVKGFSLTQTARGIHEAAYDLPVDTVNAMLMSLDTELAAFAGHLNEIEAYLKSQDFRDDNTTFVTDAVHAIAKPAAELINNVTLVVRWIDTYIERYIAILRHVAVAGEKVVCQLMAQFTAKLVVTQDELNVRESVRKWADQLCEDVARFNAEFTA